MRTNIMYEVWEDFSKMVVKRNENLFVIHLFIRSYIRLSCRIKDQT